MKLFFVTFLLASCLVTGCSRVDAVSRYGIRATLIDATSGRPAVKRPVCVAVDGAKFDQVSNRKGEIAVPAVKYGYWTWLGGPMHASNARAEISIECSEFQSLTFDWDHISAASSFPEERGVIDLGTVKLQPR